ncbi:PAS-domain containing protein [Sphingomonas sp. A2-49]|uniref:hybrid sensor histidine kinase/response regulator n=1 Tax=Sphingomonas sp. A2-49 TaxID=1391375 RepID=UPI0021D18555|nr:NahK/ErcS family hybrid sensor histidine kinase/response regulator [Sphingomonas sp. A2-49]MCU6454561.1 PAS-domain containing protein [Sphingomonas sp. A2-49]
MLTAPAEAASDAAGRIAALEAQVRKLGRINASLMSRVERSTDLQGNAFSVFETAISLEGKVRDRTADLERALSDLAATNAALAHARDAADSARSRLGDAIETINEGFAIFDADDRLLLCNQTYRSLWPAIADEIVPGVSFDEIAGRIGATGSSLGAMIAPDRWISERVAQHQVAEGGHVIALADGRWIQVNERRTSEGGIVGVYTDITDIKADEARQRAREAAERAVVLQATLDAMPQGVCVFDRDGALLAWNGPLLALLRLTPARARHQIADHQALVDWCKVALPRADAVNTLGWIAAGADSTEISEIRRLADGRSLEVRRLAMPGGGMVIGFNDVTDRLRAAEALERRVAERTAELQREVSERVAAEAAMREAKTAAEQANLSKTRFLAAASHDLLQPLNAARLFVSALSTRRLAPPNRVLVDQTASALDSIEHLLEALLEISKLDAGAITPEIVDVPLDDLFAALRAEYALAAAERGLSLVVDATDIWVRSDARMLRRILQNILSNALRYTVAGEVRMAASCRGGEVRVAISDTGPGIDPRHHGEIFEEFRRLDGRNGPGIGLGLAIVERAGRMLGHPIRLDSALGEGSTFTVGVPLAAVGVSSRTAPVHTSSRGIGARAVLVLDNEQAILDGMRAVLEGWGCRVVTALDEVAVRATPAREVAAIDVILADYHLEDGVTGDAAVARIRTLLGRAVPAVIITADRMPALRDALVAEGLHVLQKPVKPAQLRALLAQLTTGRG